MSTPSLTLIELSADPSALPPSGALGVYAKTDNGLYTINSAGTVVGPLSAGGGGGGVSSIELTSSGATVTISPTGPQTGTVSINLEAAGGGGTPGGSNTQLQYNNSGAFGADAGLTYTGGATDPLLAVAGSTSASITVENTASSGVDLYAEESFGGGRVRIISSGGAPWAIDNNAGTIQFTHLGSFTTKMSLTSTDVTVDAAFNTSADVKLGSMGANNLGFYGSTGTTQQLVTFSTTAPTPTAVSPTLTGVYAADFASLQTFNDAVVADIAALATWAAQEHTACQSIITALEAINLVTD